MLEQPLHFFWLEVTLDIRWFPFVFSLCPNTVLAVLVSMVKAALCSIHRSQELCISLYSIM